MNFFTVYKKKNKEKKERKKVRDSKGAVTEVSPCDDAFIATVFLVPKKTGDFWPVINL